MKFDGINEVLFEEAYEELLARYGEGSEEFMQGCAKKRQSNANQPKKPKAPVSQPKKPRAARKKPQTQPKKPKKPNECSGGGQSETARQDTSFSETLDFTRCQRPDGSHYGTSGVCRKGTQVDILSAGKVETGKHAEANSDFISRLKSTLPEDTKAMVGGFNEVEMFSKTKAGTEVKVTYSPKEGFNFTVNGDWNNGSITDRREQVAVALRVKKYWNAVTKALPEGTTVKTTAWDKDNSYDARVKAYERMGFSSPKKKGGPMYATKGGDGMKPGTNKQYAANKRDVDAVFFAERSSKQEVRDWVTIIFGVVFGENYSETFDYMLCQRTDGSYYGTGGVCRKGTQTTRDDTVSKIEKAAGGLKPETRAKLAKLSDEDLGRVATAVEKQGLTVEQGQQVSKAVEKLKGEQAGGKKEGGANLQDPEQAKAYSKFYSEKKDLDYKQPYDTDPKVVKATLARLKEEDPEGYSKTMSALGGKGSPTKEQLEAAGWKGRQERGEAVLKSLMDNDFKDVMGQDLSWRQGLQLDHKQAGSTGGTDRPSNWIWISTATNQAKGGMEAAARKRGGSAADKEDYIRRGLISKLDANAKMSKADVAAAKGAGAAKAAAKAQAASALRDNLPLMTPAQRGQRISDASGKEMQTILKASVASGKNPETGRNTSYRPVLSGGNGERVRKAYGTVPQMKAIARMRWNEKLSPTDLRELGGVLKASTGSTKSRSDLLNEMLGNFPRTSGLTAAERIAILDAAQ